MTKTFNFREVVRDPALIIDAVETALVFLVALGLTITGDQQNAIVAVLICLAAAAKAFVTSPWPVSVFTDLGRAALVLAATFGMQWATPDKIAITVTFLGTILTLVARGQITPNYSPVVDATGSGAGPVTSPTV